MRFIIMLNKKTIQTITKSEQLFVSLPLRLVAGLIFTAHGAQKLFAWFGGYGLDATGQWMESIGLTPGYGLAVMAGSAEFFGGIFLVIGLLIRPTSAVLAIIMLVAIFSVHINNGYEFSLALLAISVSLLLSGAGKLSLDNVITKYLG
jgi:putative oxidoreductase